MRPAPAGFCPSRSLSGGGLFSACVNVSGQRMASGRPFIVPVLIVSDALTQSRLFSHLPSNAFSSLVQMAPRPPSGLWGRGGSLSDGLSREAAFWGFTLPLTEAGCLPTSAPGPASMVQVSLVRGLFFPLNVFTTHVVARNLVRSFSYSVTTNPVEAALALVTRAEDRDAGHPLSPAARTVSPGCPPLGALGRLRPPSEPKLQPTQWPVRCCVDPDPLAPSDLTAIPHTLCTRPLWAGAPGCAHEAPGGSAGLRGRPPRGARSALPAPLHHDAFRAAPRSAVSLRAYRAGTGRGCGLFVCPSSSPLGYKPRAHRRGSPPSFTVAHVRPALRPRSPARARRLNEWRMDKQLHSVFGVSHLCLSPWAHFSDLDVAQKCGEAAFTCWASADGHHFIKGSLSEQSPPPSLPSIDRRPCGV